MDGYRSTDTSRARGPGIWLLIAMIALGLIAGVALTIVAMRRVHWFGSATTASTSFAARAGGASDFIPAQPLGPGDGATPPATDPAVLATREATLAAQLSALETRAATVAADAGAAGGQAGRAEAMLIAAAARRAIDRGTGLGYLEEQLRARFGQAQPRAVAIVIQAARAPVTSEDLRQGLGGIDDQAATGRGDGRWTDDVDRLLANLVILRQAGTPSPLPVDRLARARRLLDGGQVDAARGEIARLPRTAATVNWMNAARRYVMARQALDAIDGAAILLPSARAGASPVTTVTDSGAAPAPAPAPVSSGATAAVSPMAR